MGILDAQHGKIAALVLEHDRSLEFALVGKRHFHLVGAFDDVHIGHDQTGGVDDHAGAERALHLPAGIAGDAEETAEDRVVEQRIAVLHHLGGIDIDHRRRHAMHHRRIGEAELLGAGHAALLRGGALDGNAG